MSATPDVTPTRTGALPGHKSCVELEIFGGETIEFSPSEMLEYIRYIQRMQPFTKTGSIKSNKSHKILLGQLCFFPMHGNDDGSDALEMALTAAQGLQKATLTNCWWVKKFWLASGLSG